MKILSLSARNFRTLENFDLSLDAYYCTISGQNNAGKSAVVQIIRHFLDNSEEYRYFDHEHTRINYDKDKTQWNNEKYIELSLTIELGREIDSEVFFVVEKFSGISLQNDLAEIKITQYFKDDGSIITNCYVENTEVEEQSSSEILKKIRTASNLIVHNSTMPTRNYYYFKEGVMEVLEVHISDSDKAKIEAAEKTLQNRVQSAAKQHKEELSKMLGKLQDRYDVGLTTLERSAHSNSKFPLSVSLTDKSVEVPLTAWGTGTQNRTRVLMSILDAVRIQSAKQAENRSTPVVLVEEPESFLHPSAQAEFGKILNELSEELKIQIIATTHSPYMLNQRMPEANILLERRVFRNRLKETQRRSVSGESWMLPFAEILGIIPDEFSKWESVFSSQKSCVILVEGKVDQEYFQYFKEKHPNIYNIDDNVEVVAYGGKDALKNTQLLKFMLSKFEKLFVTYDLDAEKEVSRSLSSIGLEHKTDYCSIGRQKPGSDCIEGLLPEKVKSAVYGRETELVAALSSSDSNARKSAKSSIKQRLLDELKRSECADEELVDFKTLFKTISKAFK
jgi:putative ATP-dependent endonuclease of OLD family